MKSAGCSRVSATMRRMTGVVRSRRGRAPGKDPYFDMPSRLRPPQQLLADGPSATAARSPVPVRRQVEPSAAGCGDPRVGG